MKVCCKAFILSPKDCDFSWPKSRLNVVSRELEVLRRDVLDINDTIAGIATPPGPGGIGIIRVSGPGARAVLEALFTPKGTKADGANGELKARHFYYGTLKAPESRGLCSITRTASICPGSASYTGEDVVEFHCHGGLLNEERACGGYNTWREDGGGGEFTRQALRKREDGSDAGRGGP